VAANIQNDEADNTFHHVLVGYDGTDEGRDALALARSLAAPAASITAVCVYEQLNSHPDSRARTVQDVLKSEAQKTLDDLDPGLDTEAIPSRGATRGLHELAERKHCDLIVVGSSHRGALGLAVAGGTAAGLLRGAPSAVAVAPRGYRDTSAAVRSIGVGFDGSPESREALTVAAALARRSGAGVRLLRVYQPAASMPGAGITYVPVPELVEALRDEALSVLGRAAAELPDDVDVSTDLIEGILPELGEQAGLDLIVVGSRGYGPVKRVLLGSTSAELIRHAHYPVLVLPRGVRGPHTTTGESAVEAGKAA
jgi:nucleotide-binding universal stress UspA family protein